MCQFASGFFNPKSMVVKVHDLSSHSDTQKVLKLGDGPEPNGWREFHYLPTGEIECRALPVDDKTSAQCAEELRERWPTFVDFFNWSMKQVCEDGKYGGWLDLSSLTSAEGLTLPSSIGGWLDLSSLTSAEGLTLPSSIGGGLYLRSLTSAEGLTLPEGFDKDNLIAPGKIMESIK